ncbi:ankyrin repeat and protein kinase domain-containing protein [Colletotrichum scovillei]|uniref:Ankyrin repeat and protein kinase domain-containing protein n=1 Tax=Colletotrichum scovillei TaxID=1209932 RepID=A0A9P7UBN3_9PEZI|nr:ankyrin repeat and protein kinase domain-containing protein [Colletotrichum scovillei]KAG7065613.1 ankyrin repeat and protein kinase domain-containing protein [Colletotrichum scovillei]KAG7068213.1 ankyrin repeat and protein kinase domain-containing protein [Colletotrichum scovillei]
MADIKSNIVDTGNRMPNSPKPQKALELSPLEELFEAIRNNDTDTMQKIFHANSEIWNKQNNPKNPEDTSRLRQLLEKEVLGSLMTQDVLRYLQDQDQSITVDEYGKQYPLHVACLFGSLDAAKVLIKQRDIDVNAQNGAKESPLGIACRAANLEVAKLLIDGFSESINVHQEDDVGNTPFSYLAGRGIYPLWSEEPSDDKLDALVRGMLQASRNKCTGIDHEEYSRLCLEEACRQGNISLLKVLVNSANHSINARDPDGWTPLHFAILSREEEAVRILLENGADPGTGTKESDHMQPLQLAITYGAETIADMIREQLLTNLLKSLSNAIQQLSQGDDPLDCFKAQTWRGKVKQNKSTNEESNDQSKSGTKGDPNGASSDEPHRQQDDSTKRAESEIESVPMRDILENPQMTYLARDHTATKPMMWYHLPANNWHWAKALCVKYLGDETDATFKEVMKCFQTTFESTGHVPPLCQHGYMGIKDVAGVSTQHSNTSEKGSPDEERQPRDMLIVLPVIDVDYLAGFLKADDSQRSLDLSQLEGTSANKRHINGMRALYGQEYKGQKGALHYPRTLDHYYHTDLSEHQQSHLNKEQVLTRYLKARSSKQTVTSQRQSSNTIAQRLSLSWARDFLHTLTNRSDARKPMGGLSDLESQGDVREDRSEQPKSLSAARSTAEDEEPPHSILVVSQLWIIKLNNLHVTLFPQRWNPSRKSQDHLSVDLENLVKASLRSDDPNNVNPGPSQLCHDMVKTAIQYRPLIEIKGKRIPYMDVFSKEVLRISREVDGHYDTFKDSLGTSDKVFGELSTKVTNCLMNINDVLHELEIIKDVFEQRWSVWKRLHEMTGKKDRCKWGIKGCRPKHARSDFDVVVQKVDGDAKNVQTKTKELIGLLHGQASTETSLHSSRQASLLAVFTVLTVLFSPVSVVLALLALQIDSFTPNAWSGWQVITGSGM